MEQNNNEIFNDADRPYWEEPERHALSKESFNGIEYYTICQVKPVLAIMLCDDFNYANKLAEKMIKNGVRVFDSFQELNEWYNHSRNSQISDVFQANKAGSSKR
jgi:hypothetical protein